MQCNGMEKNSARYRRPCTLPVLIHFQFVGSSFPPLASLPNGMNPRRNKWHTIVENSVIPRHKSTQVLATMC